ncbi:MAG: hypothetical protein PUB42_07870 [Firmicutes bacterium]|nr:hypothetical protein [Bacillota bacterium]
MKPDIDWNYAISTDVTPKFEEGKSCSWDLDYSLLRIIVKGRKINNWNLKVTARYKFITWSLEEIMKTEKHIFTPKIPNIKKCFVADTDETLTLYTYGASKVRMTRFT